MKCHKSYLIDFENFKTWPYDSENQTESCDDFGELSSRYDQPHTRRTKNITYYSLWMRYKQQKIAK